MLTTRLPIAGPSVQKPIAEARPTCGLKSLTSAGVATRITPSTKPIAMYTIPNPNEEWTLGSANTHNRPVIASPPTTMLARP